MEAVHKDICFPLDQDVFVNINDVFHNPDDDFFIDFLKPYYVITRDKQFLFGSTQSGRRPDRAFYMVPEDYKLGKGQQYFDNEIGMIIYEIVMRYLQNEHPPLIVQEGIQGESGYEVNLRVITSVRNPHSGYIAWMGKMMVFPPKKNMSIDCWNYIIPERLPDRYINEVKRYWPDYNPDEPLTLYDLTGMNKNIRKVISLGVDYFGGAYKKPNLTMVWNKAEGDGMISYHAGCTRDRILKGLSGTGKTTLTVGQDLEQDDACVGKPLYDKNNKVSRVQLIGLEAASFAKSEGLNRYSPEYPGLMKSREKNKDRRRHIVLSLNIDCEGIDYVFENINGFKVKIPKQISGEEIGSLVCNKYEKSNTTNGRFIFLFSELNPSWGSIKKKFLKTESLSFKKYDILEPIFRVVDPKMAVALDSACESIITSAVSGEKPGTRRRSFAATDFMAREQSQQALLKYKMYSDIGLDLDGDLVFFINNAGYIGEFDIDGNQKIKTDEKGKPVPVIDKKKGEIQRDELGKIRYQGCGEKIKVSDSKILINLVEKRKIENWIHHPVFGYLIPDPDELEEKHGLQDFKKRFNPLNYYKLEEYQRFIKRDIKERTVFLKNLFKNQDGSDKLVDIINIWKKCRIPSKKEIKDFYCMYYS